MIERKEIRFSFNNVSRFIECATLNANMLVPRLYPFTMKRSSDYIVFPWLYRISNLDF